MRFRRIQVLTVALTLSALFIASGMAQHAGTSAAPGLNDTAASSAKVAPAAPAANWVFEGCWTRYSTGPCLDVYRDEQGAYWICRACGTTGTPGPGKCTLTNLAALDRGLWCS